MRNLNTLSDQELQSFFYSFDYVLSDVDGVLWNILEKIPGSQDAIKSLKKLGKKVILVSNNSTKSLKYFHNELKAAGFELEQDEVVTPILSIVSFLKKQDLQNKEVFVIGMTPLKNAMKRAGFKLAENGPDRIEETLGAFVSSAIVNEGTVSAVVLDVDVNLNYVNLQKAANFLSNPEVLFITGATDCHLPTGKNRHVMGPGYFIQMLENSSNRKALTMAKPGHYLHEFIVENYKITDPSRILFIGDSIPSAMAFATKSGYKKLLVLSGVTEKESLEKWNYADDYKPDFYADSLKTVHECIERIFMNKL